MRGSFDRAAAGERQIVFVTGEPGIGKTSLVEHFLADLGAEDAVRIGRGQCVEHYGQGEAYLPILEAFGRLGREVSGEHVIRVLARYAPTWLVQMPFLVSAAELRALQKRIQATTRARMLRELTEAVEALTDDGMLVLRLEDLHWSDVSTLDWLAFLARRLDPARLLLIGTYRPAEALARDHPLHAVTHELRLHRQCREIGLRRLDAPAVVEYLARRCPVGPEQADDVGALGRTIHARTEGNPLFMVNVVEDLVVRDVFVERAGRWRLTVAPDDAPLTVPVDIRQMIERQLDRLGPIERRLLEVGSVVGAEFSAAAVAAGAATTPAEVEACFAVLARHEQFLRGSGADRWPDGTVAARYAFLHALHREVLYGQVPEGRRAELHGHVGARLEAAYGRQSADVAAALAMHFERSGDMARAVHHLRAAGRTALARSAYREAARFFDEALCALARLSPSVDVTRQEIDTRLELRAALFPLGEQRRILARLEEAEGLAERLGDQTRLGHVLAQLTSCLWQLGQHEGAVESGENALAIAVALEDFPLRVQANYRLGQAYACLGQYPRAIALLEENVNALTGERRLERFGLPGVLSVYSRTWLAHSLAELGKFGEAIAQAREGLCIADEADHPFSVTHASFGAGYAYLRKGDLDQAIVILERGLSLCRTWELEAWFTAVGACLGASYAFSGRLEQAVPLLEDAVARSVSEPGLFGTWLALAYLGEAYRLTDRLTEALSLGARALDHCQHHGERGNEAWTLHLLGETHARLGGGRGQQASDYYGRAAALAHDLGMRPLVAHCHLGLGELSGRTGRGDQAREHLGSAATTYRELEMRFWQEKADAALRDLP